MSKKRKPINPQPWRLPYGQRVVVTSVVNNWMLSLGTTGTVVELNADPAKVGERVKNRNDYFWDNWEEQFVQVDGRDGQPIQMRRWHMALIDEWTPGASR